MATLSVTHFETMLAAQDHYLGEIDAAVPAPPAGVAAVRAAKWEEVEAGGGPMLQAEAEALGVSVDAVIDRVRQARGEAKEREVQMEKARIQAKEGVRGASTPAEMYKIHAEFVKSLPTGP